MLLYDHKAMRKINIQVKKNPNRSIEKYTVR